ncbi:MAG: hypothetical protein RL722_2651 [Pseudomonadota bacterium]|jgi:Fe-S cluster assembly iron-binding protein IscA
MLMLTPRATQLVLEAAQRSGAAGQALRVAAVLEDEGGFRYGLGFDEQREADEVLTFGELTVLVGAPSRSWLDGVELDVQDGPDGQAEFVFRRPDDGATHPSPDAPAQTGQCGQGGCAQCGG